jgi:hypothetical protein
VWDWGWKWRWEEGTFDLAWHCGYLGGHCFMY